ncbi:N-acetylmuramoyl-L-alanine amidase [Crocinitomix catalasitica]|nr:N-acetylmuramoyl-L-alanine amidase [Crocinitomix catalasitica]
MRTKLSFSIKNYALGYNKARCIILSLFVFFSLALYAQDDVGLTGIKTVVIDPGHGGKDPGCLGAHSKEKTVTLAIGLKLGEYIEKTYPDINVIYTRSTDVFIELDERAQIANRNNADLFICVHANAGPKAAFGAETYVLGLHRTEAQRKIAERENSAIQYEERADERYETLSADAIIARQLQLSVFLNHSIEFAAKLQKQFVKIGRSDRGVRQAGFLVLYKTTMPSVLIETGFLSNAAEENFLVDSASQVKMANAMFKAFNEYKIYYEAADQSTKTNTSIPVDYGDKENKVKKNDIVFRVQIETSTRKIPLDDAIFKGMPIYRYQNNGLYKYTVGLYRNVDLANELKRKMRTDGYEHAFVVAFQNGNRINLDKAIELSQKDN